MVLCTNIYSKTSLDGIITTIPDMLGIGTVSTVDSELVAVMLYKYI